MNEKEQIRRIVASLAQQVENLGKPVNQSLVLLWLWEKRLKRELVYNGSLCDGRLIALPKKVRDVFSQLDGLPEYERLVEVDSVPLNRMDVIEHLFQELMPRKLKEATGSFYTPENVVDYMVMEALRSHFHQFTGICSRNAFPLHSDFSIGNKASADVSLIRDWFSSLSLLDLSCGSGVFLRRGYHWLMEISRKIHEHESKNLSVSVCAAQLLERCVRGVDLQETSLNMAKLFLITQWMIETQTNQSHGAPNRIPHLEQVLIKGDALDQSITNDLTGFQLILGNPPYMGEKGNRELFAAVRKTEVGQKYYEKNMDLAYYFIHRGLDVLPEKGCLCYVTTSYFATADGAAGLRKRIWRDFGWHWLLHPEKTVLFQQAKGQHNLIFCLGRKEDVGNKPVSLTHARGAGSGESLFRFLANPNRHSMEGNVSFHVVRETDEMFDQQGFIQLRKHRKELSLEECLKGRIVYQLQELCQVNQGLVSGADRVTAGNRTSDEFVPGRGIFVLSEQEKEWLLAREPHIGTFLKPFHKNSHITPFHAEIETNQWILYLTDANLSLVENYPELEAHLSPFRSVLEKRREVKRGLRKWHSLHWPRKNDLFEKEKIVAPQRSSLNVFAVCRKPWYASADVYYIHRLPSCFYELEFLAAWLNSAFCYAWLACHGKMKGSDLELYATPLKRIPVPKPPSTKEEKWLSLHGQRMSNLAEKGLSLDAEWEIMDRRLMEWLDMPASQQEMLLEMVIPARRGFRRRHSRLEI